MLTTVLICVQTVCFLAGGATFILHGHVRLGVAQILLAAVNGLIYLN